MELANRTTPLPPRPEDNVVARHRALIAAAREERTVKKNQAVAVYGKAVTEADKVLAKAIKRARDKRVPWLDICAAAGLSRQVVNDLLRKA